MKETLSLTKNRKRISMIAATLLFAFFVLDVPAVFATSPITGSFSSTPSSNPQLQNLATYPVSVKFKPKAISLAAGSTSGNIKETIKNTGTADFVVTGCTLTVKFSDGSTVKGSCSGGTFTVKAGKSVKGTVTFTVSAGAPLGKSTWTVVYQGTVNGNPFNSKPGKETITIT